MPRAASHASREITREHHRGLRGSFTGDCGGMGCRDCRSAEDDAATAEVRLTHVNGLVLRLAAFGLVRGVGGRHHVTSGVTWPHRITHAHIHVWGLHLLTAEREGLT